MNIINILNSRKVKVALAVMITLMLLVTVRDIVPRDAYVVHTSPP